MIMYILEKFKITLANSFKNPFTWQAAKDFFNNSNENTNAYTMM